LRIALGARIALRIRRIDAVDLCALEDNLGAHLAAAQGCRSVGGEERISGAGGKNHHFAFFQVADCLAADVGLDHLLDVERRLHAAGDSCLTHGVRQRERVHHGGEHAHVVGGGPVHSLRARRQAAEDVAAADHHAELHPHARDLRDLVDDRLDRRAVDAKRIVPHQGFPRQLEKDPFVFGSQCAFPACAITSAAKSVDFFSMPSPTTKNAYPFTLAFLAASIFSMLCLSSLMNGWPSSEISPRNLLSAPSTILRAISSGLPDSLARASWIERSRSTMSAGTSLLLRCAGLAKAMCIATSLPTSSGPW